MRWILSHFCGLRRLWGSKAGVLRENTRIYWQNWRFVHAQNAGLRLLRKCEKMN